MPVIPNTSPVNPTTISWTNPTANTDGTPYDATTQNGGYTLLIDGAQQVSIPTAFATSFDITTLAEYKALALGPHSFQLEAVNQSGVASAPSAAATFLLSSVPAAPTNLVCK